MVKIPVKSEKMLLFGYKELGCWNAVFSTVAHAQTMLSCWDADPVKRPRFLELTGIFGDLLEEGEKENYIRLGEK